jgi:hypothetical protein
MFSLDIVDSDDFLDMPISSQNLYFHLGMRADDEGFLGSPKKVLREVRGSTDDIKLLSVKNYIIIFQSGVIVLTHFNINNYIPNDRFKPTVYQDEKKQVKLKKITNNKKDRRQIYTLINGKMHVPHTDCIQDVYESDTKCIPSIVEYSKVEYSKVKKNILSSKNSINLLVDDLFSLWNETSEQKIKKTTSSYRKAFEKCIKKLVKEYGIKESENIKQEFTKLFSFIKENPGDGYNRFKLDTILRCDGNGSVSNFDKYLAEMKNTKPPKKKDYGGF